MYKFFSIDSNYKEMMVMLKSLPSNTVVVDRFGKVIDSNQLALNFLKIKSFDDYKLKRWTALNDFNSFQKIIKELKKGKVIRNKSYILKVPDSTFIGVNFSASKLNGTCNLFIFQFFEVSTFLNSDLEYQNITSPMTTEIQNSITKNKPNINLEKYFVENEMKQIISDSYLNEKSINLLTKKYPVLTQSEVIVCALISLNFSAKQISVITFKLVRNVHRTIRRIIKKLRVNSRQELYQQLIE